MTNISALAGRSWTTAVVECPKHMEHGPCAGVRGDGLCEVAGAGLCSYLAVAAADWPYALARTNPTGPTRGHGPAARLLDTAATRPVVVVDLVAPPLSADGVRAAAATLQGVADACLVGDHGDARVQFPPSYRARLLADAGVAAWVGINCRDRNRVAIEGEISACLDAGAVGLHCVTGDHTRCGRRADAMAVFDLDCIGVVERARSSGALCSVAHAPAAPPRERRLPRLLAKVAAGADTVFIDHCGGVGHVADAVGELRAAGFRGLVFACVPVATSADTADVLRTFAGDRLPPGYLEGVLGARDPSAAGVAAATELGAAMLAIPGVDGVNLSGGAQPGHEGVAARELAEVCRRLLGQRVTRG